MDTRHSGRNTYDESDIQFILEILRTQNGNFNVSELARTLRELRPRHTYWSYQSFLTKNLRSGMNLMAKVDTINAGPSSVQALPMVMREIRTSTSSTPSGIGATAPGPASPPLPPTQSASSSPIASQSVSPPSRRSPSLNTSVNGANREPNDESEEEEMDEADFQAFEAQYRGQTDPAFVEPGSASADDQTAQTQLHKQLPAVSASTHHRAPRIRQHSDRVKPEHVRLLISKLVEILDTARMDIPDETQLAAIQVPSAVWAELAETVPDRTPSAWKSFFDEAKSQLWESAMQQHTSRLAEARSSGRATANGESAQHEPVSDARPLISGRSPTREPAHARASEFVPTEPARNAPDALDAPRTASRSAMVESFSTPSTHKPHDVRPFASTSTEPVSVSAANVHTPQGQAIPPSFTPATVRIGQRSGHHDAKVQAREACSGLHDEEPSPTMERRHGTSPVTPGSPMPNMSVFSRLIRPHHSITRAERHRARALYEAHVWELCADYGLSHPKQLMPFMTRANGDVYRCRHRLQRYMERLSHKYRLGIPTLIELLEVHRGNLKLLIQVLDIQQRAYAAQATQAPETQHATQERQMSEAAQ